MQPRIDSICPFFIVSNVERTVQFYCDRLGFDARHREPQEDSFFAILGRDGAQLFVKSEDEIPPLPNSAQHPWMRWDAFLHTQDPDGLANDFAARGAAFSRELADTHDGLRGFEITDPDGYVLFFGRPR